MANNIDNIDNVIHAFSLKSLGNFRYTKASVRFFVKRIVPIKKQKKHPHVKAIAGKQKLNVIFVANIIKTLYKVSKI